MRLFKNPIVLAIIAFVGGVMMADTVRPMLSKIPVIGGMLGGGNNSNA